MRCLPVENIHDAQRHNSEVNVIPNLNGLRKIIGEDNILSLKQPIISINEKRMIGYEALSRGVDHVSGSLIPPDILFSAAEEWGMNLELDRACRDKAIRSFSSWRGNYDQILFLNFDPTILNQVNIGSGWMKDRVEACGIDPSSVAIEIVESRVASHEDLERFVAFYRESGFLIVLDDFGSEHSNLNRILLIKPDIIKVDRTLVQNISQDFYKRAIVETIITLSRKIGALSLVEGVEAIEDIMVCHELGADLYQGFFFSKAVSDIDNLSTQFRNSMDRLFTIAGNRQEKKISKDHLLQLRNEMAIKMTCETLSLSAEAEFDRILTCLNGDCEQIECTYVLDIHGTQVTQTHCHPCATGRLRSQLFKPSSKGADHSLKSYFSFMRGLDNNKFFSDPYISLATGNLCRTMSRAFVNEENRHFILCMDIKYQK